WIGGGPAGPVGGFGGFGGNVAAPEAAAAAGRGQPAAAAPPAGARGAAAAPAPPVPPAAGRGGAGGERWGLLKVVTTQLKPGWLRKNGAPYSENAVITENFIRFADGADQWFTVSTIVDDPAYLNPNFIT